MRGGLRAGIVLACVAVRAAAGPVDPEEIAALVREMGHGEIERREAAFQALLDRGAKNPERVLALLPDFHEDAEIQVRCETLRRRIPWEPILRRIADTVGNDPALMDAVLDFLSEPSWELLNGFVSGVPAGRRGRLGEALLALAEVETLSPQGRQMVFNQLGHAITPALLDRVLPFLEDESVDVRRTVLSCLQSLLGRHLKMAPRMQPLLRHDDPLVREGMARAFRSLGDPATRHAAISAIEPLLEDDHPAVCREALSTLVALDARRYAPRAVDFLTHADAGVRQAAVYCLTQNPDPRWTPALLDRLEDPSPQVRLVVLQALLRAGDPEVLRRVVIFLDKEKVSFVRQVAIRALGQVRHAPAASRIAAFLDDEDSSLATVAAQALRSIAGSSWPDAPNDIVQQARAWWEAHKDDPAFHLAAPQ